MLRLTPVQRLIILPPLVAARCRARRRADVRAGSADAVPPEELFEVCAFCHGPQGQGSERLDTPALAGMEAWYVERQLDNFATGPAGMHPDDVTGLQMSIVSGMTRNDATIRELAEYIASMEPGAGLETVNASPPPPAVPMYGTPNTRISPARNRATRPRRPGLRDLRCLSRPQCRRNEALAAPRLTELQDWYQARQLRYFKDGIRGRSSGDIYGAQMASMSMTLTDQTIADLIAYIDTL